MCGRFTQTFSWDRADQFLDLSRPPLNLRPRYNVAPSQEAAVVRANRDGRRSLSTPGYAPSASGNSSAVG